MHGLVERGRRGVSTVREPLRARSAGVALYGPFVVGYVLLRLASFTGGPLVVTDTESYRLAAAVPLWDPDFYAGLRGWTIPLLYKLAPGDWPRVAAQLLLSVTSWIALAAATASCMRRPTLRPIAFVTVLLFSLSFEIVAWDSILLSESLALSLTAAAIAGWLVLVERPTWRWLAAVLAVTLLWVGTRDTNAYAALLAVPLVAVWAMRASGRRRPIAFAALAGVAVVALAGIGSANAGGRWVAPLEDSIRYHVLSNGEARAWFVEHGMPDDRTGQTGEFLTWVEDEGRGAYANYLLSRPLRTLAEPAASLDRLDELLAPDLRRYPVDVRETLPGPVAELLFPPSVLQLVFWLVVIGLAALVAAWRFGPRAAWSVPVAVVLLTFPNTLLVWHASGQEFGRHALLGVVAVRLGLVLLALFVLDAVLSGLGRDRRASPLGERVASQGRRPRPPTPPA